MGSGCFSPKPAQKDLAVFLIEQIHNTTISVSRQSAYMDNSEEYAQTKQKISKMSNLKKLIDFLHSHRHKISDALANNLKICIQKATLQNWMKGLVVLERLINMCYPHVLKDSNNSKPFNFLNNLLNHESSADNYDRKTEYSTNLIKKAQKENQPNINFHLVDSLMSQIQNVKFQNLALTLMRRCLAYQQLCNQVLNVLDRYLLIRSNNLQNDEQSLQILQCVFEKIGDKQFKIKALQTYVKLISKIREKKFLGLFRQLGFFLKRWIKIKSGSLSMKSVNQIAQIQNEVNFIEFIINKFAHLALAQLSYQPLVVTLLQLYASSNYEMLQDFEDFFVGILKAMDMGQPVLKFMILGFFYSGVRHKIIGDFEGFYDFNSRLCKEQTKMLDNRQLQKLVLVLQRWLLEKKFVKVEQIIKYHSSLVIRFFAEMLAVQNKKFNQLLKKIYQQIVNACSNEMNIFLNQCIFGQYQKKQASTKLRSNLLLLSHLTLTKNKIHCNSKIIHFTLDASYLNPQETISFYISLCYFYGKLDGNTVSLYIQEICELLCCICKFIKNTQLTNAQSSHLTKSVLQFLGQISQCRCLLIAFQEALQQSFKPVETAFNEESLRALSQEVSNILSKSKVISAHDENSKRQDVNDRTISDCKRYFREMNEMGLQSNISRREQLFQNRRSIIKDSCSVGDEEESFKDIMQMINL